MSGDASVYEHCPNGNLILSMSLLNSICGWSLFEFWQCVCLRDGGDVSSLKHVSKSLDYCG